MLYINDIFNILSNNALLDYAGDIEKIEKVKYLGIYFDSHLKWGHRVNYILSWTRYLLFVIKRLLTFMKKKLLYAIHYALFQNIAFYGIVAWGGASKNVIQPLINMQKRLLYII